MDWTAIGAVAAWVAIIVGLAGSAGGFVWWLSSVYSIVKSIRDALPTMQVEIDAQGREISRHDKRIAIVEARTRPNGATRPHGAG